MRTILHTKLLCVHHPGRDGSNFCFGSSFKLDFANRVGKVTKIDGGARQYDCTRLLSRGHFVSLSNRFDTKGG